MMSERIIVYCGTRNHYPVMEVAAKSLLYHTSVDHVYFLTEDEVYPNQLPDVIATIDVSNQNWFNPNGPNYSSSWTYMAFIRLAFAKLFPQYDKVLYLDTDTLVLQDISSILDIRIGPWIFAMVQEDIGEIPTETINAFAPAPGGIVRARSDNPRPAYPIRPYYNSGVMLMNLHELRKTGMDGRMIDEINTVKYPYPDQDIINTMCHYGITHIPYEYNVIPAITPDFPQDRIRIKHFASDKPLWKSSLWQSYRRLSWDEVMQKQNALKGVT